MYREGTGKNTDMDTETSTSRGLGARGMSVGSGDQGKNRYWE